MWKNRTGSDRIESLFKARITPYKVVKCIKSAFSLGWGGFLLRGEMLNGIDISNFQAGIRPGEMPIDFAIAQACFGREKQSTFTAQIESALSGGKEAGAYIFITGQEGEIQTFIDAVRPYLGRIVLALDWESDSNNAWGNLDYLKSCAQEVISQIGVKPLIYTMASAYGPVKEVADSLNCGLWIAQYANDNPTGFQSAPWNEGAYDMAMFQYSSTGRIAGWAGNLDLDLFYGDRAAWQAYAQFGGIAPSVLESNANLLPNGKKITLANTVNPNLFLISHNGGLQMSAQPMPWTVQKNDDNSVSLADPWGNWITLPENARNGSLPSVVTGNGQKSQRWMASPLDGGLQITSLQNPGFNIDLPGGKDYVGARVQVWGKWNCTNQTWKWGSYIAPSNIEAGRYWFKSDGKDAYLSTDGRRIFISDEPYAWTVQKNEDDSISLADSKMDWITVSGNNAYITIGNGQKSQRFSLAGQEILPIDGAPALLDGAKFFWYKVESNPIKHGMETGKKYALKLKESGLNLYMGPAGILQEEPFYWQALSHSQTVFSLMDASACWLTSAPHAHKPLEDKIGNGSISQNWQTYPGGAISPANAPFMAVTAPNIPQPKASASLVPYSGEADLRTAFAFVPDRIRPVENSIKKEKAMPDSNPRVEPKGEPAETKPAGAKPVPEPKEGQRHEEAKKVHSFLEGKLASDVANTVIQDVRGGELGEDAEAVADKLSSMIEEALGKKKLSRKAIRWVFAIAIVIALACIILAAISLAGPLPKWVAGLCALIVGSTGIGGHALGIAASTK